MEGKKYIIEKNDKLGRFLVASEDLEPGEVIFSDTAFVFGPKPDNPTLCLGCYSAHDGSYFCAKCRWPVCGVACESIAQHADNECNVFSACGVKFQPAEDFGAICNQLDCITPLRLLLAKERYPERWSNELVDMEHHAVARQGKPGWGIDQVNIVRFLVNHCKLGDRFDEELVQRVCGILEVNAIEVPSRGGYSLRAIYPQLSIASHNCVPNIVHTIHTNAPDCRVEVRSAVAISKGEKLALSYTYPLSATLVRREYLKESKFFECGCARCSDPTELKTHLSTLKCSKCDDGIILSCDPLDLEAKWKCTKCEFNTTTTAVRKIINVIQAEIDEIDMMEPSSQAIEKRETMLRKYRAVFHPHHALLLSLKHALAQLYGKVEGYQMDELPDILLERKADMCREILSVLDVITPGETRTRATMLYELHAPVLYLARNEFRCGIIKGEKLKQRMAEPMRLLEETAKILGREDPGSPEGILGQIAAQSKLELQASVDSLPIDD